MKKHEKRSVIKTRNNTADIVMNFILYLVEKCNVKKNGKKILRKIILNSHEIGTLKPTTNIRREKPKYFKKFKT